MNCPTCGKDIRACVVCNKDGTRYMLTPGDFRVGDFLVCNGCADVLLVNWDKKCYSIDSDAMGVLEKMIPEEWELIRRVQAKFLEDALRG